VLGEDYYKSPIQSDIADIETLDKVKLLPPGTKERKGGKQTHARYKKTRTSASDVDTSADDSTLNLVMPKTLHLILISCRLWSMKRTKSTKTKKN
jgi:hypothetical protein